MSIPAMFWAMKAQAPTPSSKLTLITLADCADHLGRCYPSLQYMQQVTGLSRSGVKKCMHELVNAGLVLVEAKFKDGRQQANTYHLQMTGEGSLSNPPRGHSVTTEPVRGTFPDTSYQAGEQETKSKEQEIRESIWALVDKVGVKRSTIGQLMKSYGEAAVMQAVTTTIAKVPADPESFIRKLLSENPERGSKAAWELIPHDDAKLDAWIREHGHKPASVERTYYDLRQRLLTDIENIKAAGTTPAEYWATARKLSEQNFKRLMQAAVKEVAA